MIQLGLCELNFQLTIVSLIAMGLLGYSLGFVTRGSLLPHRPSPPVKDHPPLSPRQIAVGTVICIAEVAAAILLTRLP